MFRQFDAHPTLIWPFVSLHIIFVLINLMSFLFSRFPFLYSRICGKLVSKHGAQWSPQKQSGLLGTGRRGEEGGGRLYTYRYTVTTRLTPALRLAKMRAMLTPLQP